MKFSLVALPLLSVFAAAAPVERQTETVESLITGLTAEVKQITAHINQTLASLPANTVVSDASAAVASVNTDLKSITSAIHTTNTKIAAASSQGTLADLPSAILGQLDGKPIDVAKLLLPLLSELDPALQSVLATLSLGEVYVALQPLLSTELPGLVQGLSPLVSGLLAALSPLLSGVGSLLGPILTGLAL